MQRNEYVLKNMFGSFFIATVLTALMAQLGSIADSVVIGHLVSPDALSVVRIWQPVENFMYIMIGMMSAGACFLSARGIGAQDYHQVNRVFNHHLYYVIVSALLVIYWLLLLLIVAMAYVVHRRNPLFSWPSLQITVPSNPAVTFSLPYTIEGVREFLMKVKPFVLACELDRGFHARVALEELLYEIVESNTDRKGNETFDVRIIDKNPTFTVVVKSKGPLQNPIYKFSDDSIMNVDDSDLRLAVLSKVCKDISHKYMNGINCIYLNYNRSNEQQKSLNNNN